MSTRNERFADSMLSLETAVEGLDTDKATFFSDHGRSVELMIAAIDYDESAESQAEDDEAKRRDEALFEAEMRLAEAGKAYLISTLLLIVENGSDIETSLKYAKRRTYFLHRKQLINFFCCTKACTDI